MITPDGTPVAPREATPVATAEMVALANQWWYYTAELAPGLVAQGQTDEMPLLARMALREIDLTNSVCLDIGTMEGLMPILMAKRAGAVMAIDAVDHCLAKLTALKAAHGVEYAYASVGTMYDLDKKLIPPAGSNIRVGFDLINCSGLLYHLWSPMAVLAGIRPLLHRNGLMIVSTNVILEEEPIMAFNVEGRMQPECNTFWYFSPSCLDYVLRYLRLEPVRVIYARHDRMGPHTAFRSGTHAGDISIIARATDRAADDAWMADSVANSWESLWLLDWARANSQPVSGIRLSGGNQPARVDVAEEVFSGRATPADFARNDTHRLLLGDDR